MSPLFADKDVLPIFRSVCDERVYATKFFNRLLKLIHLLLRVLARIVFARFQVRDRDLDDVQFVVLHMRMNYYELNNKKDTYLFSI